MLSEMGFGSPNQLDSENAADVPSRAVESSRSGEGGYKMIEAIDIENFRCFEKVSLDDLRTVNLVVGKNGSGKTAFLEALYFTLGSPALAFKIKGWRGLGAQAQFTEATESRNAVWRDLFFGFDQTRVVRIGFNGTGELERSVRITCSRNQLEFIAKPKSRSIHSQISDIPPIEFHYASRGRLATVRPEFGGEGIKIEGGLEPARGSFFPSTLQIDPQETARHFSSLSRQGKVAPVVAALRKVFPMIKGLSLEMEGLISMVYAELEGVPEKVPLGLISSGVSKILAILVAIANQHGGIVIVDEIENGLYYDRMADVWRTLRQFCFDEEVQLFASSHSAECLRSLESVIEEYPEEFSLLRTVQEKSGCVVRHFQGDQFLAALEEHMEVR